jgi:serine acetyltransferase
MFNFVATDPIKDIPLKIGNDVWLGHNSIIMPNVKEIGTGAVIGAGAVVNKDVPPYAVVVGNPARVVKYRFEKCVIEELLKSKWWEKSIEELKPHIREFQQFTANSTLLQQEGPE